MGWSSVIGFRESVEAALIVSIVFGYLRRGGMRADARLVWWSSAAAVGTALLLGATIVAVGSTYDGWKSDVFEGATTLATVAGLTWMAFLVGRQPSTHGSETREQGYARRSATGLTLAGLAFVAVLRQGVATGAFLFAAATPAAGETIAPAAKLTGALVGVAAAIGSGVALYFVTVRTNLRTFFRILGGFLIVVGAGLTANVLHEFQDAGWIPILGTHAYDVSTSLSDEKGVGAILRGLLGYHADATWLELAAWFVYLLVVGSAYVSSLIAHGADVLEAPVAISESQIG
jgi:high-affinity iron transporter